MARLKRCPVVLDMRINPLEIYQGGWCRGEDANLVGVQSP